MINTAITYTQLFGIGFGFGLAGPCLLTCAPVIVTYVAARGENWKRSLVDISIFLIGRFFAYLILGYLAGLSGAILQKFSGCSFLPFIKAFGGVIIICLAIFVWLEKGPLANANKCRANKIFGQGNIFALGFIMGIVPCGPLLALLLEVMLISKTGIEGLIYALFFGLGTFASGFISITALTGIFAGLASKILKSKKSNLIFKTICTLLLIWLGLNLILSRFLT